MWPPSRNFQAAKPRRARSTKVTERIRGASYFAWKFNSSEAYPPGVLCVSSASLRLLRNKFPCGLDWRQTKAKLLCLFDEPQAGSLAVSFFDFGEASLVVFQSSC